MGFLDIRAEIGNLDVGVAPASDSVFMILTCPQCATGYFVEDDQIQTKGRSVRCAACGHRWTALPERPLELVSNESEGAIARDTAEALADDAPLSGDDLPRAFRTRAEEDKRNRQAAITGAIWAGAAIVAAIVLGAGILFRESVVRAWPQTASAYAAVGLPVNPTGLLIEHVHVEPALDEGHAAYAVTGVIRNVVGRAVIAPPLRISLLNAEGKRVAGQITNFADPRIPAGATRSFRTSLPDPPFSAANLVVDFAIGARADAGSTQPAPQAGSPQAPAISLRGPASDAPPLNAVNAVPLPAQPQFTRPTAPAPASAPTAATPTTSAAAAPTNSAAPSR